MKEVHPEKTQVSIHRTIFKRLCDIILKEYVHCNKAKEPIFMKYQAKIQLHSHFRNRATVEQNLFLARL